MLCQSHKVLTMVSGCCITTLPSGCSCLLWPCATLRHELSKPSLTQCTLIKHRAPTAAPLLNIQPWLFKAALWTVPFLASPYGRESNPVETLLGVSAFSIYQVFFHFQVFEELQRQLYRSLTLFPMPSA